MGIDIFLEWDGMTENEIHDGYVGESYHGEPYATKFMFAEGFTSDNQTFVITAEQLRSRLLETKRIALERAKKLYGQSEQEANEELESFDQFVDTFEQKERQGLNPRIVVSY